MTTVLLLSSTRAKWTDTTSKQPQWHEESLSELKDQAAVPDAARLHLLLDTNFEQIDAFPMVRADSVIAHRSNIRAMHARLANQYPFAIVRSPQRRTGVDCFLVHHMNLVASMQQYVQLFESKRTPSTIVSVQSVSELYVNAYAKSAQARLLLVCTESGVKHVVGQSACVLFCRTVSVNLSAPFPCEKIVASLNETIEHLISKELLCQFDTITTIGFSQAQVHQLAAHAEPLLKSVQFEVVQPSFDDVREFFVKQTLSFANKHRHSQSRKTGRWLLKHCTRIRSRRIRAAAMVSLLLFVVSVAFTQQRKGEIQHRTQQLQTELDNLSAELTATLGAASEISDRYAEVATVLLDANSLSVVQAPKLEQLLKPLSAALQEYVQITIQELSWVTDDGLTQVASRTRFPVEGTSPSTLLVSLSGLVKGVGTLRLKQDTFRQFVKRLGNYEQIDSIEVMRSPLDSATSHSGGSTQSPSSAQFELSFTLDRS